MAKRGPGKPFAVGDGRARSRKGKPATSSSFKPGHILTERQRAGQLAFYAKGHTKEIQSKAAHARITYERQTAEKLKADGFEVLWPASVCDRICIKDGKLFFVEFKKPKQRLRREQQIVRDLLPDQYIVVEYASVVEQVDTTGSDTVGE